MNNEDLLKEIEKLRKEKEDAVKQIESKFLFLSSISHEIRTPISAIISMTNILLEENPSESQIDILKTMKFSADNLLKLLNDLLNYSKLESGKTELEEIEINLLELLGNIQSLFTEIIKQKKLDFALNIDPKIPKIILGDSLRLSQILINLINNAVKFTDSGKITVNIQLKDLKANFAKIEFSVQDSGIGIQKDKLDTIFESFNQGEITVSRKFGGTGLGLTIVRKILQLMESEIKVESEPDIGSKFYFILFLRIPMNPKQEKKPIEQVKSKSSLKGLKLLLVEDNISNQKVALRYLQKWEINADVAENGIICLEKLKNKEYDVILMDLQMPEMDGYTATRKIRDMEDSKIRNTPIIALTASALLDTKIKVEQAGMNDYITKPFVPNELYSIVAKFYTKEE